MEVIWTRRAISKLNAAADYIAKDNPSAAENWVGHILEYAEQISDYPESGRMVPEYNEPSLREIITGNYRVIYRIRKSQQFVYILTVMHARQNPPETASRL